MYAKSNCGWPVPNLHVLRSALGWYVALAIPSGVTGDPFISRHPTCSRERVGQNRNVNIRLSDPAT